MIKKKITLLLSFMLATGLLIGGGAAIVSAENETSIEYSSLIESKYNYNANFALPSAVINKGGEEKLASSYLVYPDGSVSYQTNNLLHQSGEYKIVHYAEFGGKTLSYPQTFTVNNELYSLNGNGVFTYYESYDALGGISGLEVELRQGDVFTFNQLINVSDMNRYNSICEVVNLPEEVYTKNEYKRFFMVLSDSLDPTNQVILMHRNPSVNFRETPIWDDYRMCALAGTTMANLSDGVKTRGSEYSWGAYVDSSMYGLSSDGKTLDNHSMDFYLDYQRKIVFGNEINSNSDGKIVDLDDPSVFPEVWNGFESGKAKLSLYAMDYQVGSVKFFIEKVSNFDLSKNVAENDGDGPVISFHETPNTKGIVGEKYYFTNVTALDVEDVLECNVVKNVYRYYYSSGRVMVNADEEGFTPTKAGLYTITYESKDLFGNVSIQTVDVEVVNEMDDISIIATVESEYLVGRYITLPTPVFENVCGNIKVDVKLSLGEEDIVFDVNKGVFLPQKTGTYTLTYKVVDALNREAVQSFTLQVIGNSNIETYVDLSKEIPDNFLLGFDYNLPLLKGYSYQNNEVEEKIAKIRVNNGTIDDNVFTPAQVGEVTLEYYFEDDPSLVVATFNRPVYNVFLEDGVLSVKDYFVENTLDLEYNSADYLEFVGNVDGGATFVNPLNVYNFEMRFRVKGSNFKNIDLCLSDGESMLTISLSVNGEYLCYSLNGYGNEQLIKVVDETEILFVYDNINRSILMNNIGKKVSLNADGTNFTGFEKNKALLKFNFSGVDTSNTEKARLELISLNGQVIKNLESDVLEPQIIFTTDCGGVYEPGDVVALPKCIVSDVLSPTTSMLRISVMHINTRTYISSTDGTKLERAVYDEYEIKFADYGSYLVTYTVRDAFGNQKDLTFNYNVLDTEPPKAMLVEGYKIVGRVGKSIDLATYNVTDNVTQQVNVCVFVVAPNHQWAMLEKGKKTLQLEMKGTYTIYYMFSDELGNNMMLSYNILAED